MAILAFWLFLGFFVGSLAIVFWTLYVDHDVTEEPDEADDKNADSNPLAGLDGVSLFAALSLSCMHMHVLRTMLCNIESRTDSVQQFWCMPGAKYR